MSSSAVCPCHSAHRCNKVTCEACCWRAARQTTLSILHRGHGPLNTIALTISDPSPEGFRAFRVAVRNRIDHLRRKFPLWTALSILVWFQRDGTIKGIVSLGLLGPNDIVKGLERWKPKLGPEIGPDELRVAIWDATKPSAIWCKGEARGRYQDVRFGIWPRQMLRSAHLPWKRQDSAEYPLGPMPVII